MSLREDALAALEVRGPLTARQIAKALGMNAPTRTLYAALRTAEIRGEVHADFARGRFNGGGPSKVFTLGPRPTGEIEL